MLLVGAAQPIAYLARVDRNPDNSSGHHGGSGTPDAHAAARGTARAVGLFCASRPAGLRHGPIQPRLQALPDAFFRACSGTFLLEAQRERRCDLAQFGFALVASGAQMLLQSRASSGSSRSTAASGSRYLIA